MNDIVHVECRDKNGENVRENGGKPWLAGTTSAPREFLSALFYTFDVRARTRTRTRSLALSLSRHTWL